jgi:hypothetical protein
VAGFSFYEARMTTYYTRNPVGSSAAKDLYDNAQNLDHRENDRSNETWDDRLGIPRLTWFGIEKQNQRAIANYGYITMDSFQAGATLTLPNQVLRDTSTGEYYRWDGAFPKVVPAGSTPATSGGVATGAWVSVGDAALRQNLGSGEDGLGGDLVAWKRRALSSAISTVGQSLDASNVSIWEYADLITDKTDADDPATWDWSPAFQAAADDNVSPILMDGETYSVKSPVTYSYSTDSYTDYARLPKCPTGFAVVDYSTLGNAGSGWVSGAEVDDSSQPAYQTAFTVNGLSGVLSLHCFEGIVFVGNNNTAAIKLIGCCGVKPTRCIFDYNRYGVVLNNGTASGTYTELCAPTDCRWRSRCITPLAYEKGSGDSSFHGSGFGEGCYATVPAGYSAVLIGEGCQPYNAPINANIWMSGTDAPVIRNKSSLAAHFHGNLKLEGSYKTVIASGGVVYLYGTLSTWAGIDKGTLKQALRGGPTGSAGGNLTFSGILTPTVTRYDVADAGTTVAFLGYNEEATVLVRGDTYYSQFKIQTGRRLANTPTTTPFQVINGNVNPLTKFSVKRVSAGLQLTTIEDDTVIVVMKQSLMPDESSKNNYTTADYWSSL